MPLPILPILLALAVAGSRKRPQPANQPKQPPRANPPSPTPATPDAPPTPTAAQEAQNLSDYLRGGGSFGSQGLPSPEVLRVQRAIGVKPDGIVGPATRNKCRSLGVVLPLRPTTRVPESRLTDGGQS